MNTDFRVHIVPVGFDDTRVSESLIKGKADRVYFIRFKDDKEGKHKKYFEFIKNELNSKLPGCEKIEKFGNLWDLYECIKLIREIIFEEKKLGNHIYVNVSSGSKSTAIAGMLACMSWQATPYYVRLNYSKAKASKSLQKLPVAGIDDLPRYNIIKPNSEHLVVLNLLKMGKKTKAELIDALDGKIIKQKGPLKENSNDLSIHAKHGQLRTILEPMEKNYGYIQIDKHGRKSDVTITPQGRRTLEIFGR